jgi:hypothetical protein
VSFALPASVILLISNGSTSTPRRLTFGIKAS